MELLRIGEDVFVTEALSPSKVNSSMQHIDQGQVNSGSIKAQAIFDDAVLYPNPYMVISQTGYTKHYYAGAERLATVIGGGGFGEMEYPIDKPTQQEQEIVYAFNNQYQQPDPFYPHNKVIGYPIPTEDITQQPHKELDYQCKPTFLDDVDVQMMWDILLNTISTYGQINSQTEDIYFTHSDHLGSANWITDGGGLPIQYIHYAPYGELIDNQQASWYDERYKFTGKERDWETGYDMFGARYYWSPLGWTSVDPLADKYPGISPYAYCHWSPINRIDPDGRADYYDVDGNHLCNDGVDDNRVFQQNLNGDVVLGGYATPFSYVGDVTSVKLEFNGEMEQNNHMAIGQLLLKQIGDNFEFVRASFDALSGTIYSNDCLPNGNYDTNNFRNRTADAMVRDGVGFSINLKPLFMTNRNELRIHPDGGKATGTEGCIGLTGNQSDLNSFVNLMRPLYSSYGNIPLNVNVKSNPNYHHF